MPTFSPSSRSASARLTAVVDLPTPPLPEAMAMMAATPGIPAGDGAAGRGAPPEQAAEKRRRQLRNGGKSEDANGEKLCLAGRAVIHIGEQ